MKEQFNMFMSQLCETNSTLESLTDFKKVQQNVGKISLKLCQLNYLLGKENINDAIKDIFEENPKTFDVLGILVAVRGDKMVLSKQNGAVGVSSYFKTYEGVCNFIYETGLADFFASGAITNLVDYVFGVEVGLDTNARKNRGGAIMEEHIAGLFSLAGVKYRKQVSSSEFPEIVSLGEDLKRFDFAIETVSKTYLIETNFYNYKGSKLNETARAYTEIAPKINQYKNYEFVWITDGQGWHSAKNKLEEAFSVIPSVYNLSTIDKFIDIIKQ